MKFKGLSNTQLENIASKMKLPLKNIIMRDEANQINDDGFYIVNLDKSTGEGTHWTCLYYHPLKSYYFDSFGFVSPKEIEDVIMPYDHNNKDIQYCIY